MKTAVMFSKATDEWSTPQDVFNYLDREFDFWLDAAASDENAKTVVYFTREDDALSMDWATGGVIKAPRVWLNPPYSRCNVFMAKASREAARGCTVVCLVPSRTDTRWWHEYVWDDVRHQPRPGVEVRFIKGRLKFGDSQNSAPFPSVIVILRPPT